MKDLPFHFLDLQDLVCKGLHIYLDYKVLLLKIHHQVAIHPLNHLVGAMEMVDLLVLTEILPLHHLVEVDLMDLLVLVEILMGHPVLVEILHPLPHLPVEEGVLVDLRPLPHHQADQMDLQVPIIHLSIIEAELLTPELPHKS